MSATSDRPVVRLVPGRQRRAEQGHPWIYSNEIALDAEAKALPPGSVVTVLGGDGRKLGVASFNPHALITLRLLSREADTAIDRGFFLKRFGRALEIRERLFAEPFYRLIHAEADGLPGLIVDRYGDALVCQTNTAGAAVLEREILDALQERLGPSLIVLRNESAARAQEGLQPETRVALGNVEGPLKLRENGCAFFADVAEGQKTGWFYDQRPNRAFVASLARDLRVLDVYSFTGGFGIQAAAAGASEVTLLDRSASALQLAKAAAAENGVAERCRFHEAEAFEELQKLHDARERFDMVVLDPPAFVKSRKDLGPGSRGYRKMVRLGAAVTARRGYLFAASCSHNMPLPDFEEAVRLGLNDAGRVGRVLRIAGAGPDHPIHPALPETAYLKVIVLALD